MAERHETDDAGIIEERRDDEVLASWVVSNMGEALSMVRASDGLLAFVNPAWDAMFGRPPGAPLGRGLDRLTPDRSGTAAIDIAQAALSGRWEGELCCRRFDGTEFWTHTSVSPFTHPTYGPVFLSVQTDVSATRAARQLVDRIFDSTIDLLAVATPDLRLQRVNPAWTRVLGWREDELLTVPFDERAHPDDRGELRVAREMIAGEAVAGVETRWRASDGTYRWLAVNTVPTQDPPLVVISATDITDAKCHEETTALLREKQERFEAELRASEQRFRSIFDNAPLGAVTVSLRPDTFGRVLEANDAFCEISASTRAELKGSSIFDLFGQGAERRREGMHLLRPGLGAVIEETTDTVERTGEHRELRTITTVIGDQGEPDYAITLVEDVTVRKRLERELERRALYDELTGLANRALFLDRLAHALERRRRDGSELGVVYVDIDHFKDMNDSLGHGVGDQVLREIGHRLRSEVRAVDTPARLAGDEFVVVCPDVGTAADAAHLVDRLHTALGRPIPVDGRQLSVNTSMGVAVSHRAAITVDEIMQAADTALYHAKRRGRNRWEVYTDVLGHRARHRHETEQLLRDALDRHWFRLHYQPVIDLRSSVIVGVEALIRLDHPDRGLLLPSAFIDVAEESEIIVPIGQWVLAEACRQAAQWNRVGPPLEVAVNLSARELAHPDLVDQVHGAVTSADLEPRRLCLELTERVLIDATAPTVAELDALADAGIGLALDDFGTGYSSLLQLKRFPITTIKIDRGFVSDLEHRPDDSAIIHAITTLAADLQLTTTAEGIETPLQLDTLRALGCSHAQGFLLHRPQPAESITRLLPTGSRRDGGR